MATKKRSIDQIAEYIEKLDLNYLARRLIEKENWDPIDAENAARRYKNFLILTLKYPGNGFPPPLDVDEVWHAHILHTKKYMEDCEKIFGKYLHHFPSSGSKEETKVLQEAGVQAARLYREEFGEFYHGVLDVDSFW